MQAAIAPRVTDSQLSTFELKHLIKKTNASRETMNNSIAFHSSVDVLQTVRIIAAEIWTWVAGWEPNSIYTPAGKQRGNGMSDVHFYQKIIFNWKMFQNPGK